MDNRQELLKKLHLLVQEIDKAKEMVDEEKSQYLNNYENRIEAVIKKLQDAYIVIVASLVTVVQFMMQAYTPSLSDSLGVYIPLIVVNCIILGRAESYASKNPVVPSIFDGLGMGLGFTLGLTLIGLFRELLGAGQIFGAQVLSLSWFTPITIFVMAPGAFLVLACLVAIMNIVRAKMEAKGKPLAKPSGCITGDCAGCGMSATCTGKKPESAAAEKTE